MSTERPSWRVVGPAERVVVPWANGGGTTAVVARVPDDDAWAWRLSLADVVEDGPFSSLPGVDRWIAVARGGRMELEVGDVEQGALVVGGEALAFSGDASTSCRVIDGPLVDVNLMLRRGVARGSMSVVSLGADESAESPDVRALVVLAGRVRVSDGDEEYELDGEVFDALIGTASGSFVVRALAPSRVALVRVTGA